MLHALGLKYAFYIRGAATQLYIAPITIRRKRLYYLDERIKLKRLRISIENCESTQRRIFQIYFTSTERIMQSGLELHATATRNRKKKKKSVTNDKFTENNQLSLHPLAYQKTAAFKKNRLRSITPSSRYTKDFVPLRLCQTKFAQWTESLGQQPLFYA